MYNPFQTHSLFLFEGLNEMPWFDFDFTNFVRLKMQEHWHHLKQASEMKASCFSPTIIVCCSKCWMPNEYIQVDNNKSKLVLAASS